MIVLWLSGTTGLRKSNSLRNAQLYSFWRCKPVRFM